MGKLVAQFLQLILYSYIVYLKCPKDMLLLEGQYLENGATKRKNKSTIFSRPFKVGESKVPLFLDFLLSEPSYGRFVILSHGHEIIFNKMAKSQEWGI